MCSRNRRPVNCIVPPYVLEQLMKSDDAYVRESASETLLSTAHLRGERTVRALSAVSASPDTGRRTIYDCGHIENLTGATLKRTENGAKSSDSAVNAAFDGLGLTRRFYAEVLQRNSIDDRGMRLNAFVHYGSRFRNAFWDGQEMIFGDGDGVQFGDFTKALDVIAHELTHGVTEYTANLEYHNQPGALNESISDVFGSLVKQWSKNQRADEADWLIGKEVFTPLIGGDALRSMKAPGTAFPGDPQPDHMTRYVRKPDTKPGDWGAVHYNSGIPNKAFYLTAVAIGGSAWEKAGHIWYQALLASTTTTQFQDFADTTYAKAGQMYGGGGAEQRAVRDAWRQVGLDARELTGPHPQRTRTPDTEAADSLADLQQLLHRLADQLDRMVEEGREPEHY
jgi:Zn-dependent metalloprotease